MRDGLAARARGVDVGGVVGREDGECGGGETFGGDVDVLSCEGGGGCEEDLLGECLRRKGLVDVGRGGKGGADPF